MKTIFRSQIFLVGIILLLISDLHAQILVPRGWEKMDSIRFAFFNMYLVRNSSQDTAVIHRELDSLNVNFEGEFADIPVGYNFGQQVKGSILYGLQNHFIEPVDMMRFKPLPYLALPIQVPDHFNNSLMWKYNDFNISGHPAGIQFFNNTFDANDISPYYFFL